jgi:RHS repeat-associated protein
MVEQNRSGSYTQIAYGPNGAKLALMNSQTLQKAYVRLPGTATAVYTATAPLDHYQHADWLGSARLGSQPHAAPPWSETAYAPFGEPYAQSGATDLSFTSQNSDTSSGDYDFLYREYSTQGRWASPDPAGLAAVDITNPQSWNRYSYVANKTLAFVDPSGMDPCPPQAPPGTTCGPPQLPGCYSQGFACSGAPGFSTCTGFCSADSDNPGTNILSLAVLTGSQLSGEAAYEEWRYSQIIQGVPDPAFPDRYPTDYLTIWCTGNGVDPWACAPGSPGRYFRIVSPPYDPQIGMNIFQFGAFTQAYKVVKAGTIYTAAGVGTVIAAPVAVEAYSATGDALLELEASPEDINAVWDIVRSVLSPMSTTPPSTVGGAIVRGIIWLRMLP